MTARMNATTPIARSKSAALARVLDSIPKGYGRYLVGTVPAAKASALAGKFHRLYGIGLTPAQRLSRKARALANCLLVMYWPDPKADRTTQSAVSPEADPVHWLLLATDGEGLDVESKNLRRIDDRVRLTWLGYELVRRPDRGRAAWTWRRPKAEMEDLFGLLASQLNQHHHGAVADTLARIARQPGFHGVREQSGRLCQFARARGYAGGLPTLYFMSKIGHGDKLRLT